MRHAMHGEQASSHSEQAASKQASGHASSKQHAVEHKYEIWRAIKHQAISYQLSAIIYQQQASKHKQAASKQPQ
jgi:hypothetical protein